LQLYHEPLRPQFHFTSETNWLNDPNGLVFYKGTYHMFFQHNPNGIDWGDMTWGHATSKDLVHWTQGSNAILPDDDGTIYSGSAVVDWHNTSGFQTAGDPPLICMYTCAGEHSKTDPSKPYTQCLAVSTDCGKTFTKYRGNPVLTQLAGGNRDPKVCWFEPRKEWVLALYLLDDVYSIFSSPDLKHWTQLQKFHFPNEGECPDFFQIPVEGSSDRKWVFVSASGAYLVGSFDGSMFKPEQEAARMDLGPNYYAVQTYSDIPAGDGRRIQIAWMRGGNYPGMPFNQQMSFPCRLTLHKEPSGYRIFRNPVSEISKLQGHAEKWHEAALSPETPVTTKTTGETWHFKVDVTPGSGQTTLDFNGVSATYEGTAQTFTFGDSKIAWPLKDGHLQMEGLVDRTSLELFGNGGEISFSACYLPKESAAPFAIGSSAGGAVVHSATVYPVNSAWPVH
jgi:sucrose-6-phosphate hydrolase SacC (GH32 family)